MATFLYPIYGRSYSYEAIGVSGGRGLTRGCVPTPLSLDQTAKASKSMHWRSARGSVSVLLGRHWKVWSPLLPLHMDAIRSTSMQ